MVRHWDEPWGDGYPHREVTEAVILRNGGHQVLQEVHLDLTFEGLCVPNAYVVDLIVDSVKRQKY